MSTMPQRRRPSMLRPAPMRALRRTLLASAAALCAAGCTSTREGPSEPEPQTPLDELLTGVPDPAMRERWKRAHEAGELPSLEAVPRPEPGEAVADLRRGRMQEPRRSPQRPVIPEGVPADVQPFSLRPVEEYTGELVVTESRPGLLTGRLPGREAKEELELHYRLPRLRELPLATDTRLQLELRDDVVDAALHRRIVLHDGRTPLLVLVSEGSDGTYRTSIDELGLTIAQVPTEEAPERPPVRVTLRDREVTLRPGERGTLGQDAEAVEVLVLESLARSRAATLLDEGRPNYVRVILYRVR